MQNGTKPRLHENVDLSEVAKNPICDGFTGADLAALVRDASMIALEEVIAGNAVENDSSISPTQVTAEHFHRALKNLRPSVSDKVILGPIQTAELWIELSVLLCFNF